MNKTNLSFGNNRAMSVTNCATNKEARHVNKSQLPSQVPSTLGSQKHYQPELTDSLTEVFKLHFPELASDNPLISSPQLNTTTPQQLLHKLFKSLKTHYNKITSDFQSQLSTLQMQLKLLRDSRDQGAEKIKILETEIANMSQKLKSKELDCFGRNQEIFGMKRRLEEMEKCVVIKNIQVKNVYEKWESYKVECQNQVEMYSEINEKLKLQNKKLKNDVRNCLSKITELETELEIQLEREKSIRLRPQTIKMSYLEPFSDENRYDSKTMTRNRSSSASNASQTAFSFYQKPAPTKQELIHEVKELRDNQSALLDRLAQRDKIIQNLEHTLNSTIAQ